MNDVSHPHTSLYWFKTDLRVDDNPGLTQAAASRHLLCVYCVDARFLARTAYGEARIGRHRQAFIGQCLGALREALAERGTRLVVCHGEPEDVLPRLAETIGADTLFTEQESAPEESAQLTRVRQALATDTVLRTGTPNTLYREQDLPFDLADMPGVFTPFRKKIEGHVDILKPQDAPAHLPRPSESARAVEDVFDAIDWPANETDFAGGERAGRARLDHYFWDTDAIAEYKQTRNGLIGLDYSSKFSPWLASGCLSPRRISALLDHYEADRTANKSTYWLRFELHWREFFHWILVREGARLFHLGGLQGRHDRPDRADPDVLRAWQTGRTGMPFVDAGMRELAATGYLSNRARQNVASYLARDLGQDWRRGAAWFEACLVDYDVSSNWGNWATVAGVGTDKRDNGFNVLAQAERYDPKGEYIAYWLPELRDLPGEHRIRPWQVKPGARRQIDYPELKTD